MEDYTVIRVVDLGPVLGVARKAFGRIAWM